MGASRWQVPVPSVEAGSWQRSPCWDSWRAGSVLTLFVPFLSPENHSQFAGTQGQGGGTAMIFSRDCECSTEGPKV